jgi:transcription elongation factor B subunit 1
MSDEMVQYVKLISSEGHEFLLDRSIAIAYSKTIGTMLEGSFREAQDNVIRFPDMAGYILERLVKYLHYKAQYSNSTSRFPEFVSSSRRSGSVSNAFFLTILAARSNLFITANLLISRSSSLKSR